MTSESSRPGPWSGAFLVFTELKLKISIKPLADTLYYGKTKDHSQALPRSR